MARRKRSYIDFRIALGWRWFSWLCTIICGILFVAIFFLVPETRFERVELLARAGQPSIQAHSAPPEDEILKNAVDRRIEAEFLEQPSSNAASSRQKSYAQQLNLWSGVPNQSFFGLFMRPIFMIAYPAVIWSTISYSISLACVVTTTSLNAFVLQSPPYNFSPAISGLVNIPALLGTLFGGFTGGYLTDVYSTWDAQRNGGRFRPESRMMLLFIPGLLVPTGLLMFGFGASLHLHWIVLFVANGFIAVGVASVATIGLIYVSDSCFPVAPEALLLVNGLKNVVAFGYTHGITPWIVSSGFERSFGALAGIFIAVMLSAVFLSFFGEKLRRISARWKLIYW